jgi:hypothetical protein
MRKLLWCALQLAIIVPAAWLGFELAKQPSSEIAHLSGFQIVVYMTAIGIWFAAAVTFLLGKIFEAVTAPPGPAAGKLSMRGQVLLSKPALDRLAATKAGFLNKRAPPLTWQRGRLR